MATDIILKIASIKGESKVQTHEDQIDLLSFSGGASNQGTYATGGGGGAGRVDFQDLSVSKYYDLSSVPLMQACATGKDIGETVFYFRKQAEDEALEYLTITLSEAKVTSLSTSVSSGGEERPIESVSFNFKSIKYEYKKQGDKGGNEGTAQFEWDVSKAHKV